MLPVFLLFLGLYGADAGTHSFKAFYTATTGITNYHEFTATGAVDDVCIQSYNSFSKQVVPRTDWMKNSEGPDHWKQQTDIIVGTEQSFKNNIQIAMERFNHTGGVHTFQQMYGCELEDDGTSQGFYQYGYDGDDFISLDKNTLTWTAANPQAVITKVKWDSTGAFARSEKNYLENICIEWLKKYVSYAKDSLGRKDKPEVSLLQKDSSSPVICHATGFYPKNIMMTWKKNNDDHNEDVEVSSTLPNEDGTFQKSISLSVKSEEWKKNPDVYRCVIQHVGAEKDIVVSLNENKVRINPDSDNIIPIVVGCVVALAVVLAAIIGLVVWKKHKGYVKANNQDTDSENSDQPLPKA